MTCLFGLSPLFSLSYTMLFNSFPFAVFCLAVFLFYFTCPHRFRWLVLLVASYVFYMWWRWEFAFLLLSQTAVNYFGARMIHGEVVASRRKAWLVAAVAANLGILGFFKYTGFLAGGLQQALSFVGHPAGFSIPQIILPLGISFFTFQALSYVIDVYHGKIPVERHFGRFALYMSYFPHLMAGPILRASLVIHQFHRDNNFEIARLVSGLKLALWGLFKKVVIADRLAIYVNNVYGNCHVHTGSSLLLATVFFAFQIYCDFSGYSDIAIGTSRALGYDIAQNFNLPYFARSISDFWRRWHISLSTWFRDYVFIPMGGSRVTAVRWAINILVLFSLSGLWHGAKITFVLWGALHAIYYLLEKYLGPPFSRMAAALRIRGSLLEAVQMIVTFVMVLIGWVFFRADSIRDALYVVRRVVLDPIGPLFQGDSQLTLLLSFVFIAILLAVQILQHKGLVSLYSSPARLPAWLRWTGYLAMILAIATFGISNNEFIYFQF